MSLTIRLCLFTSQDPGRVIPGKKMAGHMGTTRTTVQNLPVVRIDTSLNLIFVKGCIPGFDDAYVEINDSKKKVRWAGMKAVRKGKQEGEWLEKSGVKGLPFPAGTDKGDWPEIVQMASKA
jgi:large subunit ribosomal protein L3